MGNNTGSNPAALAALLGGDFDNFMAASTEGGIEAQEAAGQEEFVQSQSLPKECPKEDLEAAGFVFGAAVDDIFVNVQMPEGWSVKPTDHSMWSDLLDDEGRKRGSIFYKAAFYDRSAHMHLNRRYTQQRNYDLEDDSIQFRVLDGKNSIFSTEIKSAEKYSDEYWSLEDEISKVATDYLSKTYPDYESCSAYWTEEKFNGNT